MEMQLVCWCVINVLVCFSVLVACQCVIRVLMQKDIFHQELVV